MAELTGFLLLIGLVALFRRIGRAPGLLGRMADAGCFDGDDDAG